METRNRDEGGRRRSNQNSVLVGILFLLIGGALFMRQAGLDLPYWLFNWEMILIVVGVFFGFRDGFKNLGWLIMIGIGIFFLLDDFIPDLHMSRFILPVIFLGIGLMIVFRPKKILHTPTSPREDDDIYSYKTEDTVSEDFTEGVFPADSSTENKLDVASVFANVRKTIMSKNFKGGDIVTVFGGADINLIHADFNRRVEIETVNIFGGTKLIIPSSWEIKSEIVSIFGGMEDKRHFPSITVVPEKTIILKGFCMFGGIEIKN